MNHDAQTWLLRRVVIYSALSVLLSYLAVRTELPFWMIALCAGLGAAALAFRPLNHNVWFIGRLAFVAFSHVTFSSFLLIAISFDQHERCRGGLSAANCVRLPPTPLPASNPRRPFVNPLSELCA